MGRRMIFSDRRLGLPSLIEHEAQQAPFDDGLRFDDGQDLPPILTEFREAPRRIDPTDAKDELDDGAKWLVISLTASNSMQDEVFGRDKAYVLSSFAAESVSSSLDKASAMSCRVMIPSSFEASFRLTTGSWETPFRPSLIIVVSSV